MFEKFSSWPIIVVTGPQRSGTTICARMIEADTGHEYLDEELWQVWNGSKAVEIAKGRQPCVLQAPGILKDVLLFPRHLTCVIMMMRDVYDIIQSQARVGWDVWAEQEFKHYDLGGLLIGSHEYKDWVANVKYNFWEFSTRDFLTYWKEVQYESLEEHPLWVPKADRKDFNARQYRIDQ